MAFSSNLIDLIVEYITPVSALSQIGQLLSYATKPCGVKHTSYDAFLTKSSAIANSKMNKHKKIILFFIALVFIS
jgi:hypothetical protein